MWGYLNGSQHSSQRNHMILELITYNVTPQFPLIGIGAAILGDYKIVFGHQDPQVRVEVADGGHKGGRRRLKP